MGHGGLSRGVAFLLLTVDLLHFLQARMERCSALIVLRGAAAAILLFEIATSNFRDLLFLAISNNRFVTTADTCLERLFAVLLSDHQVLLRLLDLCHTVIFSQSKLVLRR